MKVVHFNLLSSILFPYINTFYIIDFILVFILKSLVLKLDWDIFICRHTNLSMSNTSSLNQRVYNDVGQANGVLTSAFLRKFSTRFKKAFTKIFDHPLSSTLVRSNTDVGWVYLVNNLHSIWPPKVFYLVHIRSLSRPVKLFLQTYSSMTLWTIILLQCTVMNVKLLKRLRVMPNITFFVSSLNFIWKLRYQSLQKEWTVGPWSPAKSLIWGAMLSAGVGLLCFRLSRVNTDMYQETFEHFTL